MSSSPHSVSPSGSPIFGLPSTPSTENGRFSPYVQMSAAEPAAMASAVACHTPGREEVLFESYLQKTPPLKSLVMVSDRSTVYIRTHSCAKALDIHYCAKPQLYKL